MNRSRYWLQHWRWLLAIALGLLLLNLATPAARKQFQPKYEKTPPASRRGDG